MTATYPNPNILQTTFAALLFHPSEDIVGLPFRPLLTICTIPSLSDLPSNSTSKLTESTLEMSLDIDKINRHGVETHGQ